MMAVASAGDGDHESLLVDGSRFTRRSTASRGESLPVALVKLIEMSVFRRFDLNATLGNLLDNPAKGLATRVMITSSLDDGSVLITVDDNGPGHDPAMRNAVVQRGVRATKRAQGPASDLPSCGISRSWIDGRSRCGTTVPVRGAAGVAVAADPTALDRDR